MSPKVLVVDDDRTLLRFLEEYIRALKYDVISASGGAEAIRLAYSHQPDLVVMDVMMPGMDGWETTTRLREMSDVPIILLTAKSSEEDKLRGFELGIDDYITKPFSFAELTARIQAVLNRVRQKPAERRNLIPLGKLVLDLDRCEVRDGEEVILLTPNEFRLLDVLTKNLGKPVSEAQLIREVWGKESSIDTAAVRRYIWLLRKKLEQDPANPRLIITVRGFGYRLELGG
jgi:two-component system KDP operon response regulator KdpE